MGATTVEAKGRSRSRATRVSDVDARPSVVLEACIRGKDFYCAINARDG